MTATQCGVSARVKSEERKETLFFSTGINPKNFQNQNDEIVLLTIDNIESKQIICPGIATRVAGYRNRRMGMQTCSLVCRY